MAVRIAGAMMASFCLVALKGDDRRGVLRFATTPSPPHVYWTTIGTPAGANVDLFSEAAKRAGYTAQWVRVEGDALDALRKNQADVFHAAPHPLSPSNALHATHPWLIADYAALIIQGRNAREAGLRVVMMDHPAYEFVRKRTFPRSIPLYSETTESAFADLCEGRADALISTYRLNTVFALGRPAGCEHKALTWVDGLATQVPLALAARPEFAQAVEDIYREVTQMALSGDVQRIYDLHGVAVNSSLKSILTISESERQREMLRNALVATSLLAVALLVALGVAIAANWRARKATREAEVAGRAKAEFLAVMSHEIRTPLNGFMGMNQMLLETPLSEEQRDYAATADRCARELHTLLGDILDLSRIDSGKLKLSAAPFAPRTVVNDVVRIVSAAAGDKEVRVTAEIAPSTPELVVGDELRVRQVLLNLAMNAQKFTEAGVVTVSVEAERRDDWVDLHVSVEDSGRGMSPELLARAFERFEQGDRSTTRTHGGSGLGLAICKQLIELMGGQIGATSVEGQGSVFSIMLRLPIAEASGSVAETRSREFAPAPRDAKILVAEDNQTNRTLAARLIEKLGYEVVVAKDGLEAVALGANGGYGAILMDCQMPAMDGYEATREIRKRESGGVKTPIIAITADVSVENRARCQGAGMNDFIAKPVGLDTLASVLGRWVRPRDVVASPGT